MRKFKVASMMTKLLNRRTMCIKNSSKSTSINSSSMGEVKASKFTLEAFEAIPDDISDKKEVSKAEPTGTFPTLEASVALVSRY
ncbi:squamosa promoter-binding-like protein 12-like protein [Corchorus olitorius]|uniref:Squamosa promoter-binding-like protein 12-like protein n=1 Tax=Corchorus olitorius TaxID=93759 RepID=A0A1R3KW44_9ROSI|nr:squamosa promoter-binding-like protein 12-like protein [Corchorus olitorius]